MILVILGICLLMAIVGWIYGEKSIGDSDFSEAITCIGGIGLLVSALVTLGLGVSVTEASTLEARLQMYTEENQAIEAQIGTLIEDYSRYESDTLKSFVPEGSDAMVMVYAYPELKCDTLVQEQLEVYMVNNEKIKEIKEAIIVSSVYKWWLYFGK